MSCNAVTCVRYESTSQNFTKSAAYLRLGLTLPELLEECLTVGELLRLEEIEQREQLVDVVLERCAGEQHAMVHFEYLQALQQLAVTVLQAMRLVDDDHL